ncbi:MAG: FG-GAP-like repeat-containing protein [Bacteroidales bacterium]|nr:FG-GAP-like repeat-containing protein [Bacteroidales bacterium]MCF8343596.1 FG-GAP-like repeat-containing protein [Bacteroidales bacterium]MCF8377707.1 FG-GAP-like repeat-containing protein [Bacteroidales bacterium]MCF8402098.1 FG-GAP-like repeat-containing protein [Bacteroidales bacterium]
MKQFISLISLLGLSIGAFSQHTFNPVTEEVGIEVDYNNLGQAVGWGDIDNDGDLDLAFSYSNPADFKLYRNDGGVYTDITAGSGLEGIAAWSVFWAEVTGDTLNDLITRNSLYKNNGDYTFSFSGSIAGQISSLADFNQDGHLDLFDRSIPGIKTGSGNGNFSDEYPLELEGVRSTVCFDYDMDGDVDILAGTSSYYENKLFRNDGDMVFTDVTTGSGLIMQNDIYGVAAGDINNDGYPDIYAAVHKDQLQDPGNYLFRNNGDGTFTDITQSAGTIGQPSTRTASFADVNNDGWLDILVDDHYFGNHLYLNNGDETFDEVAEELNIRDVSGSWEIGGDYFGTSWGDHNLDGAIDFFGSGHMSRQKLFENQNCPNNYLTIELRGTTSNFNAVGTRVELMAGGMHTYHTVIAGNGGCNFQSYPLETGLGENTLVDEIRIFWPNSDPQYLYNIQANQYIQIVEGEPVGISENPHGSTIEIIPNPAENMFTMHTNPGTNIHAAEIVNARGRLVMTQEQMNDNFSFDVSNLPGGFYILRIHTAEGSLVKKLVVY